MTADRFRFWSSKSILVYNRYSSAVLTEVPRHLTMSTGVNGTCLSSCV